MSADRSGARPGKTPGPDDATSQPAAEHARREDSADPDSADFRYDEFALFAENCAEYGLPWDGSAEVVRVGVELDGHGELSMLRWGKGDPRVVVLHGSAQNAHTWDTVALALRPTPLLAVDLPGHGRSFWRDDGGYGPHAIAEAVAQALREMLSGPVVLVGMSLGGLTANRVAVIAPELVSRLVVIDITPGVTSDKAKDIHDFVAGPQSFGSFAEIFERTVEFNPTRSAASLRRGILHNAHRLPDGSWQWNYDRRGPGPDAAIFPDRDELWADVGGSTAAYLLLRGGDSPVTDTEDVAELRRRRPDARVETVDQAGHSIQGDQPLVLAEFIRGELAAAQEP